MKKEKFPPKKELAIPEGRIIAEGFFVNESRADGVNWLNFWISEGDETLDKLRPILRQHGGSWYVRQDGKLVSDTSGAFDNPWIHTKHGTRRECNLWNGVYCRRLNLIPWYCRTHCWKTVVKPRNVFELFKLYEVQKIIELPAKCGWDGRDYTEGCWSGYFYADSLPQGLEYYKTVRKAVSQAISPKISVILKRGCTEMEQIKDSDQWDDLPKKWLDLEARMDDIFAHDTEEYQQADWQLNKVKRFWVKKANMIGDLSWKNVFDEEVKIGVHSVTYHHLAYPQKKRK
jgi:hypothetical protein